MNNNKTHILEIKTKEQEDIIQNLKDNNLIIEAVAGSGKTTTSLYIAKHFNNLNILLLTYNSKLKTETRNKVKSLKIENLEVHSFHAFGFKYYKESKSITDMGIQEIIDTNKKVEIPFNFDLIIIDESQDITPLYYEFICKIIVDNQVSPKICLLGDKNQSIYSFNKSDARYLSWGDKFFNFDKKTWNKCSLSETFRVNNKIVDFINNVFYQKEFMKAFKKSDYLPEYIITDVYNTNSLYKKIKEEIKNWGIENIFILATSLKSGTSPIRNFANSLSADGIKIFVPDNDDEKIDDKDLEGKLVFSTFHQAKGLERKLVIIFGFDNSYFKFYNKTDNPSIPPNILYVAITRASEKLILIHHYNENFLPFLKSKEISKYCKIIKFLTPFQENKFNSLKNEIPDDYEKTDIAVTELVRHIPQNILNKCIKLLKIEKEKPHYQFESVKLVSHVKEKGYRERVSTITGVAIPLYYEWFCKKNINKTNILNILLNLLKERREFAKDQFPDLFKYEKFIKNLNEKNEISLKDLLKLSNLWIYITDRFNFKLNQISEENYNWISKTDLDEMKKLMSQYVSEDSQFEQEYRLSEQPELHNKILAGFIDCIDFKKQNIWEFKCVSLIKDIHFLQLAIYSYLFETKRKKDFQNINKSKIFNKNFIKINDLIQFKKRGKYYNGKVIKIEKTKITIQEIEKNKIKKIGFNVFLKNISYETYLLKKEQELTINFNYLILNISKNEIYKLTCDYENLKKIIDWLIWNKYFEFGTMSDIEFINYNNKIKEKYLRV